MRLLCGKRCSIYQLLATFFYAGYFGFAPGSFGSLCAIIFFCAAWFLISLLLSPISIYVYFYIFMLCSIVFFLLGLWSCKNFVSENNEKEHDPKEIVIDEVAGQMLTLSLAIPSISFFGDKIRHEYGTNTFILGYLLCCFILFRIFDIVKPFPINLIDRKMNNYWGVMLDDIVAAFFAALIYYNLVFVVV